MSVKGHLQSPENIFQNRKKNKLSEVLQDTANKLSSRNGRGFVFFLIDA